VSLPGEHGEDVKDRFVTNNLDALLTALYVDLDDHVLPLLGRSRDHLPGRKPALSDAELLYLGRAASAGHRQRTALDPVRACEPGRAVPAPPLVREQP
jgi:hypothetical protein